MMDAFLGSAYPWVKSLHLIAVISWMAGLFYLPRLFAYHAERGPIGSEMSEIFKIMERKLIRIIMNPAMIVTWVAGLVLALTPGIIDWAQDYWFHVKLLGILVMTWFHHKLSVWRKALERDERPHSGGFYRKMNEVPTLLMFLIVIMVIVRPF